MEYKENESEADIETPDNTEHPKDVEISDREENSNDSNGSNVPDPSENIRPAMLTVLCILSFLGSGSCLFSTFVTASFFDMLRDTVLYNDIYASIPALKESAEMILDLGRPFFWISALCYAFSLIGAILMWHAYRWGFHIYTIAQCLLIIASMAFSPGMGVPWGSVFWSGAFVALYASYWSFFKKNINLKQLK
ncbi:MAG: hypothetical protein RRX93_03570 [Bacteroidales bacterium]